MSEEPEEGVEEQKRCANLRFPITIEPLVLLYTLSVGLNEVIRSNLIMEKIWFGDWFILMQICKNIHPETFHHLVTDLREKYAETRKKNL